MEAIFPPKVLSLMPTWQCTASCQDCGTFSSPRVKIRLALDDMIAALNMARRDEFAIAVFTGGEATLRWKDLIEGIRHATHIGLATRLVTNAWWAKSDKHAQNSLEMLKDAGLCEINFSTGDEHARFVSISTVIRAVRFAVESGFDPVVMIEVRSDSSLTKAKIIQSDDYLALGEQAGRVTFAESPWMPIDPLRTESYPPGIAINRDNVGTRTGCDSIFTTHTIQANGMLAVCCGLGIRNVPALQFGKFDSTTTSLSAISAAAESDLIKLLIRQIGPERTLERLAQFDSSISWENMYAHKCQACLRIFSDPKVLKTIASHEDELLLEAAASIALDRTIASRITEMQPGTSQ